MTPWDGTFDDARRAEIEALCRPEAGAARAATWRALVLAVAPHIERWSRNHPVLRRCGLTGEDDVRWVLVESLDRLSRSDYANLRAFLRQAPPSGPGAGEAPTPFRGWLKGLVRFAARDHLRRRLGAPVDEGRPAKRDLATDAERFPTDAEPGSRPPVTDWISHRQTVSALDEQIARMPATMQAALRLWLEDTSFAEIAAQVGLGDEARARATVRAGVARLRDRFRAAPGPAA